MCIASVRGLVERHVNFSEVVILIRGFAPPVLAWVSYQYGLSRRVRFVINCRWGDIVERADAIPYAS